METYKVSKLKKLVREEAKNRSEFKPVFGKNVPQDNKRINGKAYDDTEKKFKEYDGAIRNENSKKKEHTSIMPNDNKGMSDLQFLNMSDSFREKVAAQLQGHTSVKAKENRKGEAYGNADYGTDEIVKNHAEHAKKAKQGKDTASEIGLTGRELDKDNIEALDDTMFESKKIKKLTFKKTRFMSENHMLSKVPDELKTEGKRFIMKDSADNEYLVEWRDRKPNVTKKVNMTMFNEERDRIKSLYNYKHSDTNKVSTCKSRINEDTEFSNILGKMRSLMK